MTNNYRAAIRLYSDKLPIVFKSTLVGLCSGLITVLYRLALTWAEDFSQAAYQFAGQQPFFIVVLIAAVSLLGWAVAFLIKKFPLVSGSGIPQVKGQINGYFKSRWLSTLLAKFIGGTVAILAGLSVGREGPSIQLGAATAQGLGSRLAKTRTEQKILIASGASAGLAAAFNAPLAGVMFAFEEIFKYFSPIILLSTLSAAVVADFVSKLVFGLEPVFNFTITEAIPLNQYGLIILLGAIIGLGGSLFNKALLAALALSRKIGQFSWPLKTIVPFLLAALMGFVFPITLGGGHRIIESLAVNQGILWILVVLIIKFSFTMVSYSSGAPGGIFFPLLVIGALTGSLFSAVTAQVAGISTDLYFGFVILAMAGFFTAIVRAPITGIILMTEMTGSFQYLLPLTLVSIVAYVIADLVNVKPIYESLFDLQISRDSSASESLKEADADSRHKVLVDLVVHHGSQADGKCLRELDLPKGCLVIAIRRHGHDITPDGHTTILAEDHLVLLTSENHEVKVRAVLQKLVEHD